MTAPIALFVYNRPMHTRRTVEALQANHLACDSDLFVYADAARSPEADAATRDVRNYVRGIDGFRSVTVVERATNWGVDSSVIDGVTQLCEARGEVIVLEDDLVTSPWFLTYMNRALEQYREDQRVMQVAGFMFPIPQPKATEASFLPYASAWGWATWKRSWKFFDASGSLYSRLCQDVLLRRAFNLDDGYNYFDLLKNYVAGKTTAWDICWYASIFANGGLGLFPQKTLVENIGFDGSGVHSVRTDHIALDLNFEQIRTFPAVAVDEDLFAALKRKLKEMHVRPSYLSVLKNVMRRQLAIFVKS